MEVIMITLKARAVKLYFKGENFTKGVLKINE